MRVWGAHAQQEEICGGDDPCPQAWYDQLPRVYLTKEVGERLNLDSVTLGMVSVLLLCEGCSACLSELDRSTGLQTQTGLVCVQAVEW